MGLAGAAAGADQALQQMVAQQMLKQRLQAEIAQQEQRAALDQQRLSESARQADVDAGQRQQTINQGQQQIDLQAGDRRERSNQRGVRRMLSDAITQRQGPIQSEDRRGLAALQIEAGDDPTLLNEPQPKMRSVTVRGPKGEPINRMVPETESVQEYREPQKPEKPPKPERDPIADYEAKLKLDARYKPPSTAANPREEAADTAREASRIATALKNHKGLGGAFGVLDARMPTFRQDTADAEVLRDALTSLLTLENMGKMKGVLSDSDMKVLRQASSTIAAPMSDAAARTELQRIAQVMDKAANAGVNTGISVDTGSLPDPAGAAAQALIEKARAARKPK